MKFLHLHDYRSKIIQPMKAIEPLSSIDLDVQLIVPIKDEMGLSSEDINDLKKTHEYISGNDKFRHSLLWSKKLNAHFILIIDNQSNELVGYTCQDIEGQYVPCKIISPYLEDDYEADSQLIDELLELIDSKPGDSNAFAVLESGASYIQTVREDDGFLLEYQAVSLDFHFKVPEKLALTDVKNAFQAFNQGDDKWSYYFEWERIDVRP